MNRFFKSNFPVYKSTRCLNNVNSITINSSSVFEAFVSGADGTKAAFIAKTSNWSHKGKPKHDDPMSGKAWIGEVEIDASSGQQQIQIGIPVMDQGKAIGSIVIGFNITKM